MALEYSIEHEQVSIKVTVKGQLDYVSVDHMWKDILAACNKNDCSSILGIANIEAPTKNDAYDLADILDAIRIPSNLHIAWVENNPSAIELAKFVEVLIRNRGLAKGRLFGSVSEARRWLAEVADNSQ